MTVMAESAAARCPLSIIYELRVREGCSGDSGCVALAVGDTSLGNGWRVAGLGSGERMLYAGARFNRQNRRAQAFGISSPSQGLKMILKVKRDCAYDARRLRARARWVKRENGTLQKVVRFSGG